jgi:hypothetical protein
MSALPTRDLICGVDPGLRGSVAYYNFEFKKLECVHDMPTRAQANGRNEIDLFSLTQIIDGYHARTALAVIENVHSMPNQGVSTTFTFGYAAGVAAGTIGAFNIPIYKVEPSVWKRTSHSFSLDPTFQLTRPISNERWMTGERKLPYSLSLVHDLFAHHSKERRTPMNKAKKKVSKKKVAKKKK